jgi:Ni2+-binding GTPase involved in maturation of urease and hydrogenase
VLVPYGSHQHAIRFLDDIRSNDHGLGLFLGPPLSGKTSTIRQLTGQISDEQALAVVDGADKDVTVLLREILREFGYGPGFDTDNERLNMIAVFAMQQTRAALAPLLIVENAHALGPTVLKLLCDLAELRVKGKSGPCNRCQNG